MQGQPSMVKGDGHQRQRTLPSPTEGGSPYEAPSPYWTSLFSHSAVSSSLRPSGLQHARLPCPSPFPGGCSNSGPLSRWCHPTGSASVVPFSCPQSFPAAGSFSSELAFRIRWPKHWSFSFSISPSNEYSGLTSFRMDWSDLLAVQGTLKSFLQRHSSKASILRRSWTRLLQDFSVHSQLPARPNPRLESLHLQKHGWALSEWDSEAKRDTRTPQVWDPLWAVSPAWGQKKKLVFSSGVSASRFKLKSAFLAGPRLFTAQRRGLKVSRDQPLKLYDLSANSPGHLALSALSHSSLTPQAAPVPTWVPSTRRHCWLQSCQDSLLAIVYL